MRENTKLFIAAGLCVAIGFALLISPFASTSPDGLNKVAIDKGFDSEATDHALDDSPLAGYSVGGIDSEKIGKALSALIGVLLTFGIGLAFFGGLRSVRGRRKAPQPGG